MSRTNRETGVESKQGLLCGLTRRLGEETVFSIPAGNWAGLSPLVTCIASKVAFPDARRRIWTVDGSTIAWLGTQSFSPVSLSAGVILAQLAVSLPSPTAIRGQPCAIRELLLRSGVGFKLERGAYGLRFGHARVSPKDVVAGSFELALLGTAIFHYFITLVA